MSKICWCIPQNCDSCAFYDVEYCPPDIINIAVGLTARSYYLWIRDKSNNIFMNTFTSTSGNLVIDTTAFPLGMFTPNFGAIDLYLSTDSQGQIIQPLIIGGQTYNCIILSIDEPVYLTDDSGCVFLTDDDGNPLIN